MTDLDSPGNLHAGCVKAHLYGRTIRREDSATAEIRDALSDVAVKAA